LVNFGEIMRNTMIFMLLIGLIGLTGCSTGPRYSFEIRKVSINTTPPGAKVYQLNSAYRNDTFLGTTPITDQPVSILINVEGKINPYGQGLDGIAGTNAECKD
jgi:murein DD-endopeptidase MepM/ murein hydrolase activator NlpD